jgi:thiosulfate/3-mercaptopyruvate sulfurtransferase
MLTDAGWGAREYVARHIPGAVYAHLESDLSGPVSGHNGRHPLPDPAALVRTLGVFGIADGVQVVAYDQDNGMFASRLWWLLRWMGHHEVAVLDGGFARWIADQRPTATDARAPERYRGEIEPIDRVPGHIPGAINDHFMQNVDEHGVFRSPEVLRTRLTAALAGGRPDDAVFYCGSGVTACHSLLALELAGLPGARLYAGSWSEWSSDPSRPVEPRT